MERATAYFTEVHKQPQNPILPDFEWRLPISFIGFWVDGVWNYVKVKLGKVVQNAIERIDLK